MTSPRTEAQNRLLHYFGKALGDLSATQASEIADIVDRIVAVAVIQTRREIDVVVNGALARVSRENRAPATITLRLEHTLRNALQCFGDEEGESAAAMLADMRAALAACGDARDQQSIGPILDLLQADPHQWSTRPCPTCRSITALAGVPFGCTLYRQQRQAQDRKGPS